MSDAVTRKCWYLKQANIFEDISMEEMEEMSKAFNEKDFVKKEVIFSPRDNAELIYILKQGEVTLYRLSPDGKKVILDILKPGSVFGNFRKTRAPLSFGMTV